MSDDFSLVMPFVVCQSQGGPYEDQAFVAGWEMGALDALLAAGRRFIPARNVRTASLPQVELIAMRYGYVVDYLAVGAESDDEWSIVSFGSAS